VLALDRTRCQVAGMQRRQGLQVSGSAALSGTADPATAVAGQCI
jgi:hypothetical protein